MPQEPDTRTAEEHVKRPEAWPLECPVCGLRLRRGARELTCSAGHSFDVAREGYINLLTPQHRQRGIEGDLPAMLSARRRFLEAGHYRPLLDSLEARVTQALGARAEAAMPGDERSGAVACVLEVGCGEGYYIGGVAAAARAAGDAGTVFVGADVSKTAVRMAAKHYLDVTFVVADVNRRIYVRDASVTVLLDIFAPRNPAEFARVLEPGGVALIVIPAEAHLGSLREELGLLGIQQDKEARVVERFGEAFQLVNRTELSYPLDLSAEARADLVEMGPNHFHRSPDGATDGTATTTEAAFVILELVRRSGVEKGH